MCGDKSFHGFSFGFPVLALVTRNVDDTGMSPERAQCSNDPARTLLEEAFKLIRRDSRESIGVQSA
jgi:hypothetical protein